jgi:hypothetical protein
LTHVRAVVPGRPNPPISDTGLPLEWECSDDTDFNDEDRETLEDILLVCKDVFHEWNLYVNEDKTEFVHLYVAGKHDTDVDGALLHGNEPGSVRVLDRCYAQLQKGITAWALKIAKILKKLLFLSAQPHFTRPFIILILRARRPWENEETNDMKLFLLLAATIKILLPQKLSRLTLFDSFTLAVKVNGRQSVMEAKIEYFLIVFFRVIKMLTP